MGAGGWKARTRRPRPVESESTHSFIPYTGFCTRAGWEWGTGLVCPEQHHLSWAAESPGWSRGRVKVGVVTESFPEQLTFLYSYNQWRLEKGMLWQILHVQRPRDREWGGGRNEQRGVRRGAGVSMGSRSMLDVKERVWAVSRQLLEAASEALPGKGQEATFWGDGNVLY